MLDRLISLNALRKEVERNFDMQNLYLPVHILDVAEDMEEGIVHCRDCKWWDKKDESNYGYCHACKHGFHSNHWEIGIYRIYREDWYCADWEEKDDEEDDD